MGANTKSEDSSAEAVVMDALRRIVRELRTSAGVVERQTGVSGAQLFVLEQLREAPAGSMNELAARTATHQSSASVVVRRLMERGLVAREPDPNDGRRVGITLTPAGRAALESAPPTAQARLVDALRDLTPADMRALRRGMDAWVRAARLEDASPPPFFFEEEGGRDA